MESERAQIEAAIASLEGQRSALGAVAVDAMLAGLCAKLAALVDATPPPEPAQTLKQVTILFLDVVGSTTLAQRLDPEGVSVVMDGALARGTAIVEAHRGRVLQYAGDNILAAFGADEAREDDAERAVQCALALLALGRALGRALGAEVLARHGHAGFDVRVGIHTGGVLLGGGVDAEGTIRGSSVNIAARMEQTAPPGGLRISHDTYAQVRGLFEVVAQEPLAVKGVDAPVQSQPQGAATVREVQRGGQEAITNRDFLPPELSTRESTWQLQHLGWQGARLAVVLVHRTGRDQDRWTRRFEFDLAQDRVPLVAFYTATHRQGRVDWQQVDLVERRSTWCRDQPDVSAPNLARAGPQPVPAELETDAPMTTLGSIGPAFEYVPPIKRRTVR
jgi:class 3 adenylate cyclase